MSVRATERLVPNPRCSSMLLLVELDFGRVTIGAFKDLYTVYFFLDLIHNAILEQIPPPAHAGAAMARFLCCLCM